MAATDTNWIHTFRANLNDLYPVVSKSFDNCILTGSGALALLVLTYGMGDDKRRLPIPNDLDFLVVQNDTVIKPRHIGTYSIKSSQCETTQSITYEENSDASTSFDLMSIPKMQYCVINGINVILPSKLLKEYMGNKRSSDCTKIEILQQMINSDVFFNMKEITANSKDTSKRLVNMGGMRGRLDFGDDDDEDDVAIGRLDFGGFRSDDEEEEN